MTTKPELRRHAREVRAKVFSENFANRIATFADDLRIPPRAIVAGYWPIRDEADPRGLMKVLAAGGHLLALPRIEAKSAALSFRRWRDGDALVDNHHGIAEPRDDAERVVPDVVLVPLIAFDASGHRLGYGGGYYDRTLAALRASRAIAAIGIAYAGQEMQRLPHEPHDHPLDAVLTEHGLHHTPGTSR